MTGAEEEKAFLGVGWSFPVCLEVDGLIDTVAFEEDIRQAIKIILSTNRGERVMRPDFGAGLNAFVFEPVSVTTMELVRTRVEEALIDWEPRIDVEQVKVSAALLDRGRPVPEDVKSLTPGSGNALLIDITYRVRATNSIQNLVYPFYLQEGAPK
jgi:phage baseplate assembly protein W